MRPYEKGSKFKGGKFDEVPVPHNADDYLRAYVAAAGIANAGKQPFWRTAGGRTGRLTGNALQPCEALSMIQRRAGAADLPRRSAITRSGRPASRPIWRTAAPSRTPGPSPPESRRTTKPCDRHHDQISLDEIGRILI